MSSETAASQTQSHGKPKFQTYSVAALRTARHNHCLHVHSTIYDEKEKEPDLTSPQEGQASACKYAFLKGELYENCPQIANSP